MKPNLKDFNPDAIVAWIFCMSCGYLIGGNTGAIAGLAIVTGVQLGTSIWLERNKRLSR